MKKINKKICSESEGNLVVKESCALAALAGCPNLIRYYGCWIDDGHLHIQTEYCNKGSFDQFITPRGGILDPEIPEFSPRLVSDDVLVSGMDKVRSGLDANSVEYRMSCINDDDDFDENDDDDDDIGDGGGVGVGGGFGLGGAEGREDCLSQCNVALLHVNTSGGAVKGGMHGGVGKEYENIHDMTDMMCDQNMLIDSNKENMMENKRKYKKVFQNINDMNDNENENDVKNENDNDNENEISPHGGIEIEISENSNSHSFESANYQLKFAEAMQNLGEDSRTSDSYSCFSENNSGNGFQENTNSLKFTDMKCFTLKDSQNNEKNTNDNDLKCFLNDPNSINNNVSNNNVNDNNNNINNSDNDNKNDIKKNSTTTTATTTTSTTINSKNNHSKGIDVGEITECLAWVLIHSMGSALHFMHCKGQHRTHDPQN